MLSSPTKSLQNRQRQHRRQNSTPTAFEATKAQILPTISRHGSHRRGMSLDHRRQQQFIAQQDNTVSTTNQGFNNQQYLVREAQQHRPLRPGQHLAYDFGDAYPISPQTSPLRPQFDPGECSPYTGPVHSVNQIHPQSRPGSFVGQDFNLFDDAALSQPNFLDFPVNFPSQVQQQSWQPAEPSSRPSSAGRRISNGIADRVAKFESIGAEIPRLLTPPNPDASSYFPITPGTTPHRSAPQRFLDDYDTSMEETLKPTRSRSNPRTRSVFDDMREKAERESIPSPPGTVPLPGRSTFDSAPIPSPDFLNMSNLNMDFLKAQGNYKTIPYPSISTPGSPEMSSPELPELPLSPTLDSKQRPLLPNGPVSLPQSPGSSKRASSFDINVEESITETGITGDDIAAFIEGPDPNDNKWLCLYPNCKKRFGRKENIKSHVQTHLGDRQYQCSFCKKCFVRQHDLKRHAKIHSGVKPYPCACGNSFARHDALTRHRQRGMCIGAFEGIVKKVVKRGRPRKNRPDVESRLDKAARTRSKNKAMSSASSISGDSDSSGGDVSPLADSEMLDDTMDDFDDSVSTPPAQSPARSCIQSAGQTPARSPLQSAAALDCVSPGVIQHADSPSQYSTHSHQSQHSDHSYHSQHSHRYSVVSLSELNSHPSSPAKSVASIYNTPPDLCLSSSPPHSSQYFDLDLSSNGDHDESLFLDAFNAPSTLSQLESNPDLLMLGKFDETFCSNDIDQEMFRSSGVDDVFFGSP